MPLNEFVDKVSQNAERNERNEKSQCARENDNRCCGKFQVFRKKRLQDFRKVNDADGPAYPSGSMNKRLGQTKIQTQSDKDKQKGAAKNVNPVGGHFICKLKR